MVLAVVREGDQDPLDAKRNWRWPVMASGGGQRKIAKKILQILRLEEKDC